MEVNGYDVVRAQVEQKFSTFVNLERVERLFIICAFSTIIIFYLVANDLGSIIYGWLIFGLLSSLLVWLLVRSLLHRYFLKILCPYCQLSLKQLFFSSGSECRLTNEDTPDYSRLYSNGTCPHCQVSFDTVIKGKRVPIPVNVEVEKRLAGYPGDSIQDWWLKQGRVAYRWLRPVQTYGVLVFLLMIGAITISTNLSVLYLIGLIPSCSSLIEKLVIRFSYRCSCCNHYLLSQYTLPEDKRLDSIDCYMTKLTECPICQNKIGEIADEEGS